MEVDLEGVARIHRGLPLHLHVVQGGFVGGAEGEHGSPHILVQGEVNRYITSAKPCRPERATHYGDGGKTHYKGYVKFLMRDYCVFESKGPPALSDQQNLICHKVMGKQRLYSKLPSTQFLCLVAKGLINYKTVAKLVTV